MSFCACSCSQRRRFFISCFLKLQLNVMYIVLDFKSWAFSRVCGHIQQHFYCAETAIYELAVKLLTLSFDSPPPISLQSAKFRRFGNVFRWFFCILYADVRHTLRDLLTLNSCHTWRVTCPTLPPSLKTVCLRRRFAILYFKSRAYSRIYGHFQQHLYCACTETVIYELPV